MDKYKDLLAHYDKENPNNKQYLLEHLLEVSRHSKQLGNAVGIGSICELIGLLHDFGKSQDIFQLYIKNEYKGIVNHSSAGGIVLEYIANQVYEDYNIENLLETEGIKEKDWHLYIEILQYPILAHHGLYDIIDNNFDYRTGLRLDYDNNDRDEFMKSNFEFLNWLDKKYRGLGNDSIYNLYYEGFKEFIKVHATIRGMVSDIGNSSRQKSNILKIKTLHFYYGAFVRLLLSILKDADIYDSSNYYRKDKDYIYSQRELSNIWEEMSELVENLYKSFSENPKKSDLDIIRTNLSNEIYNFSKKYGKGAYKLDMPVGSGKTYAGLRYAVGNAKKFQKSRIFYCTAFLSVLEQNAASIKDILGNKYVLEHHSNIVQEYEGDELEEDQRDYDVYEYLKESWESPLILTTLVQFSNTLFKHKASNIRRFSKLINSVIIIDEIQSLPTKAIFNFNLMTNFLTKIMNCTIVHSTATPPSLDNKMALQYPCNYGNQLGEPSIIESQEKATVFQRVDYHSLLGEEQDKTLNNKELLEHIKVQLKNEKSALIVLNTKNAVASLYEELSNDIQLMGDNVEVIYLTTNQCPNHRLKIIKYMKNRLIELRNSNDNRKIICVSTKLIEAGVDIDFDIVYRSLAGIDSIIQCGGRCNREGKKSSKGNLYIFKYEDENLKYLKDIEKQIDASKTALKIISRESVGNNNIDIDKARDYYFKKLYLNEEASGNYLEYPIDKGQETIFNLLTNNKNLSQEYKNKHGEKSLDFRLKHSFKTAAIKFNLIEENITNVIVQYDNEKEIDELYEAIELYDYYNVKRILEKLQPYTVSIRMISDYENYITKELDGEIFILNKEAYDEKVGLIKDELQSLIC